MYNKAIETLKKELATIELQANALREHIMKLEKLEFKESIKNFPDSILDMDKSQLQYLLEYEQNDNKRLYVIKVFAKANITLTGGHYNDTNQYVIPISGHDSIDNIINVITYLKPVLKPRLKSFGTFPIMFGKHVGKNLMVNLKSDTAYIDKDETDIRTALTEIFSSDY